MAKDTNKNPQPPSTNKPVRKVSRLEDQGFTKFEPGDIIQGTFVYMKTTNIRDRNSHERKDIRVYVIKTKEGNVARISSRALLDDAFDELCAMEGGVEKIHGRELAFIRGEDVDNGEGNQMGTYAIELY